MQINKVAVIGSGVMGASIAAHIANSNTQVLLLDIIPKDAEDRNSLANNAIQKLLKSNPEALTHKSKASLITAGNLQDDLDKLSDIDWIIEVVLEDLDIKKDLYNKINKHKKPDAIVSSNTSTIPLHKLAEDMDDEFKRNFAITHFFNPPRYMKLLELVKGEHTSDEVIKTLDNFCDVKLGKGVVNCNDTAGFIANRIGCFWLMVATLEAMEMDITVEEADAVMGKPIGVPKTGVFGLLDLIGIDLMPLIANEFSKTLPKSDPFLKIYKEPELITKMISDGYTGRKGKGGFYRLNTDNGGKVKESINLKNGDYSTSIKPRLKSVDSAKKGLRFLFDDGEKAGEYAKSVMLQVLSYAASLVPEIADDIVAVDKAMKLGYNWKYGPFELIDKLSFKNEKGSNWLISELEKANIEVPDLLHKAKDKDFYKIQGSTKYFLNTDGEHKEIGFELEKYMLADRQLGSKPILKNASASLWDIGDGVACLEYTSKMNAVDPLILEMIAKSTDKVSSDFKGLVIGNDSDNFCVGANIGVLLFAANVAAWKDIRNIIKQGQDAYMGLKYSDFPVVTAVSGMALGGGCEILLHSDAVQAHIETYTGLVEVGVGIIPGWGGCKEMLYRNLDKRLAEQTATAKLGRMFSMMSPVKTLNTMPAITHSFENIALAKTAKSAEQAKDMLILTDKDSITMNRSRLLHDAKEKCLSLSEDYKTPEHKNITLPGKTAKVALEMAINGFVKSGKATAHDEVVTKKLAYVLSGGDTDISKELSEQDLLDLELDIFMELVRLEPTLDRIEYMLNTGKPLRN